MRAVISLLIIISLIAQPAIAAEQYTKLDSLIDNFKNNIRLLLASISGSYGGAYEITSADCTTPGYNDPTISEKIYYNTWYNDGGWRVTKYDKYTYGCPDEKSKSSWFTNDRNLAIKWGLAYGANPSVAEFLYTLNLIKSGSGSIEKIDANNNWIPSETSFTELANTAYRLRAVSSPGYNFKKWCTGDCSGVYSSYSEISWKLTGSETLTAVFELAPVPTPAPTVQPTATLPPPPTVTQPTVTPPVVTASPTPQPIIKGALSIWTIPSGAKIYINNIEYATTSTSYTTIELNPGDYNIKISKDGYYDYSGTTEILPNLINKLDVTLTQIPGVTVTATETATATTTVTSYPTVISTSQPIQPIQTVIVVQTVYVPGKSNTPGFEAAFAIIGLLIVAFLVLRQKKEE